MCLSQQSYRRGWIIRIDTPHPFPSQPSESSQSSPGCTTPSPHAETAKQSAPHCVGESKNITFLRGVNDAIATTCHADIWVGPRASIVCCQNTRWTTSFRICASHSSTPTENAITTASVGTIIEARIARLFIPIVTFFDPHLENAITTASVGTIVATSVVIIDVPVITSFDLRMDNAIRIRLIDSSLYKDLHRFGCHHRRLRPK